jgi:uncharacterized RDD family membrane protein YckC
MEAQTEDTSIFDELEEKRRFTYATPGQRFVNYLIDTLVMCNIYSAIVGGVIGVIMVYNGHDPNDSKWFTDPLYSKLFNIGIGSLCVLVSYTLIEGASKGRSLGKLITKTQALREDGSLITYKDALMRSLCRLIPFDPLSAFNGNPWHDKWTQTIVVKKYK